MKRLHSPRGLSPIHIVVLLLILACCAAGVYSWSRPETLNVSSEFTEPESVDFTSLTLDTSEPREPDISGHHNKKDELANFKLFNQKDMKDLNKSSRSKQLVEESVDNSTDNLADASTTTLYETVGKLESEDRTISRSKKETNDAPLFTPEEIRQLERSARNRRVNAMGGPPIPIEENTQQEVNEEPEPEATPEEEEEPSRTLLGGQARGYTLLSLMHPNARQSSERHIDLLIKSRVARLLLGVLVDGTFSYDRAYFENVVRRLGGGDQRLTLVVYLANGPTMRRYDITPITAGFSRVNPDDFRDLIRFDTNTRERYAEIARRVRPILVLNRSIDRANRNIVIPMLEDNLTSESYLAARTLARSILGDVAEFVRNPCPGCWDGNDTDSSGDPLELHSVSSLELLNTRDFFSLDGLGFHFSGEPATDSSQLDATAVVNLIDFSRARGLRGFALWRADRQGLSSGASVHPDNRVYASPNPQFEAEELALLRHNLIEIVEDPSSSSEGSETTEP